MDDHIVSNRWQEVKPITPGQAAKLWRLLLSEASKFLAAVELQQDIDFPSLEGSEVQGIMWLEGFLAEWFRSTTHYREGLERDDSHDQEVCTADAA